jgi:DNA processing protein
MQDFYWYWLCSIPGIGTVKQHRLLDAMGSAKQVYEAGYEELRVCEGLSASDIRAITESRKDEMLMAYRKLKEKGISIISKDSRFYPENLHRIYDYPTLLYSKGTKEYINTMPIVAIVGARACTAYGKQTAWKLAKAFANMGIAVVSGMAAGIDTAAHTGALAGSGRTYAVLGCGVDICYPMENIELYMQIQREGVLLSEYAPGTKPYPGLFPKRNRLISGMADAVVVVEARKKSGSLITVDQALEQNKDIFAVPGRADDALSEGCNNLIKLGAAPITVPEDILQCRAVSEKIQLNQKNNGKWQENEIFSHDFTGGDKKSHKNKLATEKDMVYSCLNLYPKNINNIMEETGLDIAVVNQHILELQLEGKVDEAAKNCYVRNYK